MNKPTAAVLVLSSLPACREDPFADHVAALGATGVVGVSAERVRDGEAVHASAGVADRATDAPIGPEHRWRIASTTKTFTAALVLTLVEDGTLDLDDPASRWVPGLLDPLGDAADGITVRQLLQHRSGLPNHVDDLMAELGAAASAEEVDAILHHAWTAPALVALATAHPPLFPPGEAFGYTDTGYVVLGQVVEAATGEPWADALAARVLAPLDLAETTVPTTSALPDPHLHGYARLPFGDGPADVSDLDPSSLDAAAAIVSTPADVNRFFGALLGGELVGDALLDALTDDLPTGEPGLRYGLGLASAPLSCGGRAYLHSGDTLGYHTRNGVSEDGARSVTVAISGDADFEAEAAALVDDALCGP